MKIYHPLLIALICSTSTFATRVDGVTQQQLQALYSQRDAIAKGLSELSYDICMKSKITTYNEIFKNNKRKPKNDLNGCMAIGCVDPNNPTLVLPLKEGRYSEQRMMSEIMNGFLEKDRKNRKGKPRSSFYKKYYKRLSCLKGDGINLACKILKEKKPDSHYSRDGDQSSNQRRIAPNNLAQFDGDRACEVANSKQVYVQKLRQIQQRINQIESIIYQERMPDRPYDSGNPTNDRPQLGSDTPTNERPRVDGVPTNRKPRWINPSGN